MRTRQGKQYKTRDNSNVRYGVLIGPVPEHDISSFKEFLMEEIPKKSEVDSSNFKSDFEKIPNLPIFSLELVDFQSQKNIAYISGQLSFNEQKVIISITSLDDLDKYMEKFSSLVPKLIHNDHIDFTKLFFKFGKEFRFNCNYPQGFSSLLFFASVIATMKGVKIKSINLASNRIRNVNGMRLMKSYFPDLEKVTIGDNQVKPEELKEYLPDTEVTDEAPIEEELDDNDKSGSDSDESSDSLSDQGKEDQPTLASPPHKPYLVVHKERRYYKKFNLSMFDNNVDMIEDERVYAFLNPLFDCLMNRPKQCSSFYADDAILSLMLYEDCLSDKSYTELNPLCIYLEKRTNLLKGTYNYWKKDDIYEGLSFIFPYGFNANISDITSQQIDDNLYVVDMHGGVIGQEGFTYPFDRTFLLRKEKTIFLVANDCVCLRY